MATAFGGLNVASAGGPQVNRYADQVPSIVDIGVAGTLETYTAGTDNSWNRWARYAGGRTGFYFQRNEVWRSDNDQRTLTLAYTLAAAAGANVRNRTGLYVHYGSDGVRRMIGFYSNAGTGVVSAIRSTDGVVWTEVSSGVSDDGAGFLPCMPLGSVMICMFNSGGAIRVLSFDPVSGAFVSAATAVGSSVAAAYSIIWDDTVFFLRDIGAGLILTRLVLGVFTDVATIDGAASHTGLWKRICFIDPSTNNLIVISQTTTNVWKSFEITPAFAVTEQTALMITGTPLAAFGATAMLKAVIVDQPPTAGAAPTIYAMAANGNTDGTAMIFFQYTSPTTAIVTNVGSAGNVAHALVSQNSNPGGERFFTPGSPNVELTGNGVLVTGGVRRKYRAWATRTQILATIGGAPAAHDLSTTPLTFSPVQAGTVTIRGVVAGVAEFADDNGAGAFPISVLLPAGGTVTYATGAMTGVTAALDAGSTVVAYSVGGAATVRWYRQAAVIEYPAGAPRAALSSPTSGIITGGNENTGVAAQGAEFEITVDMTGFVAGDRFSLDPEIIPT